MTKFLTVLTMLALILPNMAMAASGAIGSAPESVSDVPAVIVTAEEEEDTLEDFNRAMYRFNETVDDLFLEPVARGYRAIVPEWGRNRVSDAVINLSTPVTFLNAVLQADVNYAFTSFWRFVINSTLGIGGLFDVASDVGLEERKEDFGQTLGVYGAGPGGYIVVPFIGPSSGRDLIGRVVDIFTDPFNYMNTYSTIGVRATDIVSTREGLLDTLDEIEETSFDPYATLRSAYLQKRANEVLNGGE